MRSVEMNTPSNPVAIERLNALPRCVRCSGASNRSLEEKRCSGFDANKVRPNQNPVSRNPSVRMVWNGRSEIQPRAVPNAGSRDGCDSSAAAMSVPGDTRSGAPGIQGPIGSTGPIGPQGLPGTNGVVTLNGLKDAVTVSAGQNVTLTPGGNNIQISVGVGDFSAGGNITAQGNMSAANINTTGQLGADQIGTRLFSAGEQIYCAKNIVAHGQVTSDELIYSALNIIANGQLIAHQQIYTDANVNAQGNITSHSFMYAYGNITSLGQMYAGGFNNTSDRHTKENFDMVDSRNVLERVVSLPISKWNFKTDPEMRHIGPMAQDFYAAFKVGPDDKHISTIDEGGVALAAIQGLNEVVQEKEAQIAALKQRLTDLEKVVSALVNRKGGTP